MVGADREQFLNAFGTLCVTFDKEPSELLINVYFEALSYFPIEQIEKAISQAIATLKFFPKPVELIDIAAGGGGRLEDIAEVEAGRVLNAVRRHGHYASVKFEDPVTNAVILRSFGGWVTLARDMRSDQQKWFLKDFAKAYQAYARQGIKDGGHLPGQIEIENRVRGYQEFIPEPVKVNNRVSMNRIEPPKKDIGLSSGGR